jgi:hypothetical protein
MNKTVNLQVDPTIGEWFVTGAQYDSPPSDGLLYEILASGTEHFFIGTSTPMDTNNTTIISQDPTVVRCTNT